MKRKKIGLYCGSFNKFTIGHLDIFKKSKNILGEENVLIAIGCNPAKPISDIDERAKILSEKLNSEVITYNCFLHELIIQKQEEGYDVVLIRGIRNSNDFEYENNQLKFMQELEPRFKVVSNVFFGITIVNKFILKLFFKKCNVLFLLSDKKYKHISSSAVRQLEAFRPGSGDRYLV